MRRHSAPTLPPPFDMATYVSASETRVRAAHETVTRDRKMPSIVARPRVVMSDEELGWIVLTPAAGALLGRIDGRTTVLELIEAKLVGSEDFFDAMDELLENGVVALK